MCECVSNIEQYRLFIGIDLMEWTHQELHAIVQTLQYIDKQIYSRHTYATLDIELRKL